MERHQKIMLVCILLIATLTQITTDIYLPSLPAIAYHFKVSMGQSQATMAYFAFGVALTTLLYGPLSEGVGRKAAILIGIIIGIVGTLFCVFAQHIQMLYIGRFIQGSGIGACAALWRSVFRDSFSGDAMTRLGGVCVCVMTFFAVAAPMVGGFIQQHVGWQVNFQVLLVWMLIVVALLLVFFKESSQHHGKHRLNLPFLVSSYKTLLKDPIFMGFSLMAFVIYGGLFAWFTAGPIIMIHDLGIQPSHFGSLMIFTAVSTALGGVVCGKLVKRFSQIKLLIAGLFLIIASGAFLLVFDHVFGLSVYAVMVSAMLYTFASTFVFIIVFSLGFENVGEIAGYAGSLYSCIQTLGGFLFGSLLSHLNTSSADPMAWMFVVSALVSLGLYQLLIRRARLKMTP